MSKHVCFKTLPKFVCWIGKYYWKFSNYQNYPRKLCASHSQCTVHEFVSEIRNKLSTVSFTGRWLAKRLWLAMCTVFNRILSHKLCCVWDCHRTGTLGMILFCHLLASITCYLRLPSGIHISHGCCVENTSIDESAMFGSFVLRCNNVVMCWDFCSVRLKCISFENIDSGSDI